MFYTGGVVTDTPLHSVNHYASLPLYSDMEKAIINDLCASCARTFVAGLKKVTKEDVWFGALDVFPYINERNGFSNKVHPIIRKWAEDWQKARVKERSDVDIDKSTKSQFGRIFYEALLTDKNATYKWRKIDGKFFEYCCIK